MVSFGYSVAEIPLRIKCFGVKAIFPIFRYDAGVKVCLFETESFVFVTVSLQIFDKFL